MATTQGPEGFYTAVICRHGHVLTSTAELSPEDVAPFCENCSSPAVSTCDFCGKRIPGSSKDEMLIAVRFVPPKNCRYCASAMPWQAARLDALHELTDLQEGLTDRERAALDESWVELTRDTARTDVAVVQVKRLLPKLAGPSADAMRKIITDVATEAVRRQMGL